MNIPDRAAGQGTEHSTDAALPPIPSVLGSALTQAQAAQALAEQRAAATAKKSCVAAWDDFHTDLRKSLATE